MGQAEKDDYEDQTNTEVLVDVDISALESHAADHEAPTMEGPTTQRKVDLTKATKPRPQPKSQATSLPADTEPETLDPTYVVSLPGEGLPGVPAPGAEGEPDTLKPPQTLGVRQIANASGPISVTKPGIGRVEAQAMDSILEETTSTSSRNAWLESARKMLLPDSDDETQSSRRPVVSTSSLASSSQAMPSPKPARSPVANSIPSIPDIGTEEREETQTERRESPARMRKNVTMVGIAPPANPVEVKIPPSPPAPVVSTSTETRRAGPELAVYVPPARRDEQSFLPKLHDNDGEVTDIAAAEKTDVEARPPPKAPLPLPTPPKKDDKKDEHPFETKREPLVALPPPPKPLEVKVDAPLETKREPPVESKPATVKLQEAKKAMPQPTTSPIGLTPIPIGHKTMVSPAISPSNPREPFGLSPSAAPQPKKEVGQKTLASPTAASLLMGATPAAKPPPVAPSAAKGGTARPPPLAPIEEAEPKKQTVVMKAPAAPVGADSSKKAVPNAAESSASAVPAVAPSTPALEPAPAARGPTKSKIALSPIDAMRRSPQLLAAVIATSVLLLISGIGVGYIIRGSDPASTKTNVEKGGAQASTSTPPSTSTPTTTNEPPPKTTATSEPAPPATVALADPLDEASPSGATKGTTTKPKPHPHSTVTIPVIKAKPKPKPAPTTPAATAAPPPPPPAQPKGFDPNSI